MVGKKRVTYSLKSYYFIGIFFIVVNSAISLVLFLEYRNYCELTANLLELQSQYEAYLLFMKEHNTNQCLVEDKQFVTVDRSESNLKTLVNNDREIVSYVSPRIKSRKKTTNKSNQAVNRKAIFSWPLSQDSFWISSFFGPRRMGRVVRMHAGIDLAALKGTAVMAAAGGKIIKACYEFGYGNTIVIEHNRKYKTRYAHLDKILVEQGQNVQRGQKIGAVGDTGFVQAEGNNASHLHFEVYAFNKQVNPILYLPRR